MTLRFLILSFALVFVTFSSRADTTLESWQHAEIWAKAPDGAFFASHMDDTRLHERLRKAGKKYPTVLFFHDCGANRKAAGWHFARVLARAGFAVILPDSFARKDRPVTCEHWQLTPLTDVPRDKVHAMRLDEIRLAQENVRELSWVDTNNLFLMGHGEGGDAVAAFPGAGHKARVISGALCEKGIKGSMQTAMLSIASKDDRLFEGAPPDSCAKKAQGRPFLTLLYPGYQHDTSSIPEAREAVIDFLTTQLAQ